LSHIALPLAVFFDRRIRGSDCGEEELHRVSALVADLVTEIKPIDLAGVAHHLAIVIAAATRWLGRRDNPLWVFVSRSFVVNVFDDVLHDAICPRIRVLLPDVAADSSQMIFLATGFPSLSRGFYDPSREAAGCSVIERTGHLPCVSTLYVIAGCHLGWTLGRAL
jgi:hypothetical protein